MYPAILLNLLMLDFPVYASEFPLHRISSVRSEFYLLLSKLGAFLSLADDSGWNLQCNVEWWWSKWVSFLDCGGKLLVFTTVKLAVRCPKCRDLEEALLSPLFCLCLLYSEFSECPPPPLHHGVRSLLDAVVFSSPVLIEASSPTPLRCWSVVLFWWCLGFGVRVTQASEVG